VRGGRGEFTLGRAPHPAIATLVVGLLGACGASSDVGDATSGSVATETSVNSESSASSSSSGTPGVDGSTTAVTTSSGTGESSTTTGGAAGPELCRAAVTEAECDAAGNACSWRGAWRVLDVDTCTLEPAPDLQCWAIESSSCFDGAPQACVELDIHPRHREIDGELQLLDLSCAQGPAEVESDPTFWEICHHEELEDLGPNPPVCACLCGGTPPN